MKNKVIIVTGGSGLLGKAILADLRFKGAIPINFDIKPSENLYEYVECDITNDSSVSKAVNIVYDKYGEIHGLVNNAYPRSPDWGKQTFEETNPDSWRMNIDIQLNSHALITQQVIRLMVERKAGSIVNIASIYGIVGNDFTIYENTNIKPSAEYSAVKGGIINLTRYLASFYGKFGIRVNCVSPGGIFDNQPIEFVKAYAKKVPLKRMGTPDDISPTVSFLLSDEARYITGHNLIVDGGWTAI